MKKINKNVLENVARYSGFLIVLVSVLFVAFKLIENKQYLMEFEFTVLHLFLLVIGPFLFVLGCFILSWSWGRLLVFLGEKGVRNNTCIGIYARANIAKYLPGNVFHFAGRHVIGLKNGFSNVGLGFSLFLETVGLTFAASIVGTVGAVAFGIDQNLLNPTWAIALITCLCLIPYVSLKVCSVLFTDRFKALPQVTAKRVMTGLSPVFFLYILFFCLTSGILVMAVVAVAGPVTILESGIVLTVFAVSWIAGLLTPGSPSGIGVREAIIISLLGTISVESDCIMISFFFRILTTLGDLSFLVVGLLKRYRIEM